MSCHNRYQPRIYGISVTDDNYPLVIGLLKERFGKREHIVEPLYSQLQHLATDSNRFTEVKNMYEAVEKIIRQLESQEDIGHQKPVVVQQILCGCHREAGGDS